MDDPIDPATARWAPSPSTKEKNAVQRAVTALLDELAPERAVKRAESPRLRVEQHRTPGGCVLQAANAAVSVSWFPDATADAPMGELHVVVWDGIVTRRGAPRTRERAVITGQMVVRPVEQPLNECVWVGADGTTYDTAALAARILRLLEEQIGTGEGEEPAK